MECTNHRKTKSNKEYRYHLNSRMKDLPTYSGGDMWRVCPYCAYEQGMKDAMEHIKSVIQSIEIVQDIDTELQIPKMLKEK